MLLSTGASFGCVSGIRPGSPLSTAKPAPAQSGTAFPQLSGTPPETLRLAEGTRLDRCVARQAAALDSALESDPRATFDSAWRIIERTHWDTTFNGVDWNALGRQLRPVAAAARTRGELRTVLSNMLSRLRQSHFAIIPQEAASASSSDNAAGERSGTEKGTGWLGMDFRYLGAEMLVTSVDTGGPAWQAGVRPGWSIEAVGGCPTRTLLESELDALDHRAARLGAFRVVTHALDSEIDDSITVAFRAGTGELTERTLVATRPPGAMTQFGNLPPVSASFRWQRLRIRDQTVGLIRFNTWMPVLMPRLDEAIDSLRNADAMILDLRGNLGGVSSMASGLAGHFLDSTFTLATIVQRNSSLRIVANPRRVNANAQLVQPFAGPVAILVDELSASTTETFVAGMQGLGRAAVFGSETAGQALPSVSERLPNGDILFHAVGTLIGPNGDAIEGAGVTPDRVTNVDRRSLSEGVDPVVAAAVAWVTRQRSVAPPQELPRF